MSTIHNFQGWNSHSARLAPDGATLNTSTRKARSAPISVIGGVRCQTPFDTEPSNEDVENASKITRGYARSRGPRSNNGKQTATERERQQWIPSRRPWRKPCCGTYRHKIYHHPLILGGVLVPATPYTFRIMLYYGVNITITIMQWTYTGAAEGNVE